MKRISKTQNYPSLITDLASLIAQGWKAAIRYVNTSLVITYWMIRRRIVEHEQKGKEREEYGEELLEKLSKDLIHRFGRGFSPDNLEAIDLKIGEFTYADAGQMNLYLNYLKDREKLPEENDPDRTNPLFR